MVTWGRPKQGETLRRACAPNRQEKRVVPRHAAIAESGRNQMMAGLEEHS